jgi:hypothetical protein
MARGSQAGIRVAAIPYVFFDLNLHAFLHIWLADLLELNEHFSNHVTGSLSCFIMYMSHDHVFIIFFVGKVCCVLYSFDGVYFYLKHHSS